MNDTNHDFIMLPTVDFCFKELMKNPEVRTAFIAALLDCPPSEVPETELLPTDLPRHYADDKLGILDVHVRMLDGRRMNLEMQMLFYEYWDARVLFYLGKMFTEQLKEGDPYDSLKKCIHVSILNFSWFDDEDCCHTIHLFDDEKKILFSELLEIQFLELTKLPSETPSEPVLLRWMRFFHCKNRKEFEHMAKTDKHVEIAYQELIRLSADEKKRLAYEARQKAIRDFNSQVQSYREAGFRDGQLQGRQEGRLEGRKEGFQDSIQILQLYKQGVSVKEISAICHKTENDIEQFLLLASNAVAT